MSTRSFVAVDRGGGVFEGIYIHANGSPERVGATLAEHYTDEAKIDQLVSLGYCSILAANIGERHSFEKRFEAADRGESTFYHRDRLEGWPGLAPRTAVGLLRIQQVAFEHTCEFLYIRQGGRWSFCRVPWSNPLTPIQLDDLAEYLTGVHHGR